MKSHMISTSAFNVMAKIADTLERDGHSLLYIEGIRFALRTILMENGLRLVRKDDGTYDVVEDV